MSHYWLNTERDEAFEVKSAAINELYRRAPELAEQGEIVGPLKVASGYGLYVVQESHPAVLDDGVRREITERLFDRWLPEGLTRAVFTSGGSESMDAAIRRVSKLGMSSTSSASLVDQHPAGHDLIEIAGDDPRDAELVHADLPDRHLDLSRVIGDEGRL